MKNVCHHKNKCINDLSSIANLQIKILNYLMWILVWKTSVKKLVNLVSESGEWMTEMFWSWVLLEFWTQQHVSIWVTFYCSLSAHVITLCTTCKFYFFSWISVVIVLFISFYSYSTSSLCVSVPTCTTPTLTLTGVRSDFYKKSWHCLGLLLSSFLWSLANLECMFSPWAAISTNTW